MDTPSSALIRAFKQQFNPSELVTYEWAHNGNPRAIVWFRGDHEGLISRRGQWRYVHPTYTRRRPSFVRSSMAQLCAQLNPATV